MKNRKRIKKPKQKGKKKYGNQTEGKKGGRKEELKKE